jgi:hypothetical protein
MTMSIQPIYLFTLIYLISIIACKPKVSTSSVTVRSPATELPDDFIEFYKQFHQDSQYQISHIVFPLPGMMRDTAGRDSAITWLAENWIHHQSVTPDDLWSVDFTIPVEGVIIEFIHAKEEGYWMERRFARMDDKWNLIYYAGLREVNVEENEE